MDSWESAVLFYDEAGIQIYLGSCVDVLPMLAAGSIDLVFTSPPYNLGMSASGPAERGSFYLPSVSGQGRRFREGYGEHDDCMPWDDYVGWQQDVLRACWRLLADDGAIYYNHKPRQMHKQTWLPLVLNPGLPLRQIITWDRGGGVGLSPAHYCSAYEWIMVFAGQHFNLTSQEVSSIGDVWRVPFESNRLGHPAPFPLALPKRAIETTGAQMVLDPFMGSGTTAVACQTLGRQFIGVEVSEIYCEMTVKRLRQLPLFAEVPASYGRTDTGKSGSQGGLPLWPLETREMAECDEQE